MVNKYSIDEFAQFIRDDYGEDLADYDNLSLVQSYFQNNPQSPQLQQLENPDLLFPTAVEEQQEERDASLGVNQPVSDDPVVQQQQQVSQQGYTRAKQQFEQFGSDIAAGFGKQLMFNMESHIVNVPSALVGMVGWGANKLGMDDDSSLIKTSESLRKWGKDYIQETIADDLDLQALQIWNEEEPVKFFGEDSNVNPFTDFDIFKRSLASALPSMIEMTAMSLGSGGVTALGYVGKGLYAGTKAKQALSLAYKTGKLGTGFKVGGMATGVALEGSETWNSAMEYGKSQGLSDKEAADIAGTATAIAAPIKGAMEYLSFGRLTSAMGIKDISNRELSRIISGKVIENAIKRGGVAGLKNSVIEGTTEWGQFMTDAMVQQGYKEGFGDNTNDYVNTFKKVIAEEGWSDEARASIHGGMILGGTTSTVGGMTFKQTPEKLAQRFKDIDKAAEEAKAEYPDDLNALKFIEQMKSGRYVKAMEEAMEGFDESQRKEFFEKVESVYNPKGFDETLQTPSEEAPTDSKVYQDLEVDEPKSSELFDTPSREYLSRYVDGIISPRKRESMNDVNKMDDSVKEGDEWKVLKQLYDAEEQESVFRALTFLTAKGQEGLDIVNNKSKTEKNAFYTLAIKGLVKDGLLAEDFNIGSTTSKQREQIVAEFALTGKFKAKQESEVGGEQSEQDESVFDLSEEVERMIYAGQDIDNDNISKRISEQNQKELTNNITTEDQDKLVDEYISQGQSESELEKEIEAEIEKQGVGAVESNPNISSSVAKQLKDKGIPSEDMGKMTESEINEAVGVDPSLIPDDKKIDPFGEKKDAKLLEINNKIVALRKEDGSISKKDLPKLKRLQKEIAERNKLLNTDTTDSKQRILNLKPEKMSLIDKLVEKEITDGIRKNKDPKSVRNKVAEIMKSEDMYVSDTNTLFSYIKNRINNGETIGNNKESFGVWRQGKTSKSLEKTTYDDKAINSLLEELKEKDKQEASEETEVKIPKNEQNRLDIFEAEEEIAELQKLDGVNIKRAPTKKGYENRIGDIKIDKGKQTKGTGTKIVNAFKKLLKAKGRDKIEIDVNPGSEGFWEKMGFTFVAETREGYPIMAEDNTSTINPPTEAYGRWTMEYDLTAESSDELVDFSSLPNQFPDNSIDGELSPALKNDKLTKDQKNELFLYYESVDANTKEDAIELAKNATLEEYNNVKARMAEEDGELSPSLKVEPKKVESTREQKVEAMKKRIANIRKTRKTGYSDSSTEQINEKETKKVNSSRLDTPSTAPKVQVSKVQAGAIPVKRKESNRKIVLSNGAEIQYNDHQQKGYDKLIAWADKGLGHFGLQGYAGTGKSTLLNDIKSYIESKNKKVSIAVPTHKAKQVLIRMGNEEAMTLASLMNLRKNAMTGKFEAKIDPRTGERELSQQIQALAGGVLIIDEGSMINDSLMEMTLSTLKELNINAIFVGDAKQLPPVGQNYSSAFKPEFYEDRNTAFDGMTLGMVERQDADNPLFGIYTQLRDRIGKLISNAKMPFEFDFTETTKDGWGMNFNSKGHGYAATFIESQFIAAAIKSFRSKEYQSNKDHAIITSATHKRVKGFNDVIRKALYNNTEEQIVVGETLMPNETYKDTITNSESFEILEIEETTKKYGEFSINGYKTKVRQGIDENGANVDEREIFIVKNEIAPRQKQGVNDPNNYYINSNEDYVKIIQNFKERRKSAVGRQDLELIQDQEQIFKSAFISQMLIEEPKMSRAGKKYFEYQDGDIDYGYAVNVHKIQGSTYNDVFYDEMGTHNMAYASTTDNALKKYNRDNYGGREVTEHDRRVAYNVRDRMVYTAMTRPSERLFIFRPPNKGKLTDKAGTDIKLTTEAPAGLEFQEIQIKDVPLYKENLPLFNEILDRLQKHFPEVTLEAIESITKQNGTEVLGQALGMLAQWSKSKATMDTVPHEYSHIYLNMYANQPIVKQGLKKFGNENLAEYMGLYYQDRLGGSLKKKVGLWLKQFWLKIKKLVGANFSDQDVKDYLAGSMFSGTKLGNPITYSEGQWDFDMGDLNNPEFQEISKKDIGREPQDRHNESFFQRELGIRLVKGDYPIMNELARTNDDFDVFYEQFKSFILGQDRYKEAEKAFNYIGKRKFELDSFLRKFWHQSSSKVPAYKDGVGLEQLEAVFTSVGLVIDTKGEHWAKTFDDGSRKQLIGGKKIKDFYMTSFSDRDGVVTIRLNLNDISREVTTKAKQGKESSTFFPPEGMAKFTLDSRAEGKKITLQDFAKAGYIYVGSKGGDNSSILFTKADVKDKDMSLDDFVTYLDKEISDNNMTEEQTIDFSVAAEQGKIPYSHIKARHEWWKSVKYPQYLMGTHIGSVAEKQMGVQDHYDRLKIDMNDGYKVRSFGSSSIMTVEAGEMQEDGTINGTYFEYPNGTQVPSVEHDGTLWSSGTWFKKLGKTLNVKDLTAIKGMVRSRVENEDGSVDYIGVKSVQLRPYKGMKLMQDGKVIAEYKGQSTSGTWVDSSGKEFDHLSTTDTSKMTNGKFSKFNEIQTLDKGYQSIIMSPSEEKNGAFPVTQGELAMSNSLLSTPVGSKFYKAIRKHYKAISDSYTDDLFSFITEPSRLYKVLKTEVDENDIMTEMQKLVEIIGEEGLGFMHPAIYPMWKDSIANKFIKKGLFKARDRENNKGSLYFYKPYYAPAMGQMGELQEGDFVMSAESKSIVSKVEKAYTEATGVTLNKPKNIYEGHVTYWKVLNSWLSETGEDGKYTNNVPVLLSRQPVAKITGVVMRNVRGLAMGGHGKTMMLSKDDVLKVFDGDWDGDKGIINIIDDKEIVDAYVNFQKSPTHKELDRVVNLDYFGKRGQSTSLANEEDVLETMNSINAGAGQIGMVTNSRNTMFSMHRKGVTLNFPKNEITIFDPTERVTMGYISLDGITSKNAVEFYEEIVTRNNDKIMSRTNGVDKEIESSNELRRAILDEGTNLFLNTTKQNELSIVLQMAVDDSKYSLLGNFKGSEGTKIAFSNEFMTRLIFKDYIELNPFQQVYAKKIKSTFNHSAMRQGYSKDDNRTQMKLEDLFKESSNLKEYENENKHKQIHDVIIEEILEKNNIVTDAKGNYLQVTGSDGRKSGSRELYESIMESFPTVSNENRLLEFDFSKTTPQEDLLLTLGEEISKMKPLPSGITNQKNNPLIYEMEKGSRLAHEKVKLEINRRVKERFEEKFDKVQDKDREVGVSFSEQFSKEYFTLIGDKESISIDFNQELQAILDEYIPIWNKMTPRQQMMSTIKMIQGTKDTFGNNNPASRIKTFFPMDIVHPETFKLYLRDWHRTLISEDLKNFKMLNTRDQQAIANDGGYNLGFTNPPLQTKKLLEKKCG